MSNIAEDTVTEIADMLDGVKDDIMTLARALAHPHPRPRTTEINLNMQLLQAKRTATALASMLTQAIDLAERANHRSTGKGSE